MRIEHIAIWAKDIDRLKDFYMNWFSATAGPLYHNPRTGLTSYFLTFPDGAPRLEIMNLPEIVGHDRSVKWEGFCHICISVGSKEKVDEYTEKMREAGVTVLGNPRTTGEGYYESVLADPEGNIVELTI